MELAGLEPATSWVRSTLPPSDFDVRSCRFAGPFSHPVGGAVGGMAADARGFPLHSGTLGD
jgi:hypothetical protein